MRILLPALLLVMFVSACLPIRPHPDPAAAAEHYRQAQTLLKVHDYPAALKDLERAHALDPRNATYVLAHGDIAETGGDYRQARSAYQDGLDEIPGDDLQRPEITWRLALLLITHFDDTERAARLAGTLRGNSFRALDLDGMLHYRQGDERAALARFEQARALAHDPGQEAFALYHASLAHRRLGQDQQTFASLFEAINQARSHGLAKDIERFFQTINQPPAARQP